MKDDQQVNDKCPKAYNIISWRWRLWTHSKDTFVHFELHCLLWVSNKYECWPDVDF